MSKKMYIMLDPDDVEGGSGEIFHLIRGDQNEADGEWFWPDNKNAICGKCRAVEDFDLETSTKLNAEDENAVRLYLAKQQNAGLDICAACVAGFYSAEE